MFRGEERRFKLTLHYDGSSFFGWQVQPGTRTVQGELEAALARITGRDRRIVGSGRTDRGVHATGQVAAVTLPARWEAAALRRALNAVLPGDVWVAAVEEVPPGFHPRYDAVSRTYVYRVGLAEEAHSPFHRRWCWALRGPAPDLGVLRRCAERLQGEHSFRAFAKSGQEGRGDRCLVEEAAWRPWDSLGVAFAITADRFLHRMVRYLVGTMVEIARGRRPEADLAGLLAGSPGLETSPPAPPQGLFLTRVTYPPAVPEPGPERGAEREDDRRQR